MGFFRASLAWSLSRGSSPASRPASALAREKEGQLFSPNAYKQLHFNKKTRRPGSAMNALQKLEHVKLGKNAIIRDFVNLYGCAIGDNCRIGTFVEIQKNVQLGNNIKISSHTFICEGVTIEDDVFIGHNVCFINDKYPRATNSNGELQTEADWKLVTTTVKRGAAIGSGSTILCGVVIGENAMIGAGSVVVRNVPPNTVVAGNPARMIRELTVA
jgi:acetyltransferase-like isoleucine patch superfamily enzyme